MILPNISAHCRTRLRRALLVLTVVTLLTLAVLLAVARVEFARYRGRLAPLLAQTLTHMLGRAVRVGDVSLRGLDGVEIRGLSVARGNTFAHGATLTLPDTTAYVNLFSFLLHHDPVGAISDVVLTRPALAVARNAQGRWDFQDVLDRLNAPGPAGGVPPHPRLVVRDGRVHYQDARVGALVREVVDVNATLNPGWQPASFAFNVSGRDALNHMGRVDVSGRYVSIRGGEAMRVNVRADRIVVKELTRFLPKRIPITFENGTAALRLSALFTSLPSPEGPRPLSADALTATVDITGVGLRLQEMNTSVVAQSGLLRLVHDRVRYPQGSRLELLNVRAKAGNVPMTLDGSIRDINLFDLNHLDPQMDLTLKVVPHDAADVRALFAPHEWPAGVTVTGPAALDAQFTGRTHDLHIDGTLTGDHLAVAGMTGQELHMGFHLRPGAHPAAAASVQLDTRLAQAQYGALTLHDLAFTAGSATPWTRLDNDPHVLGAISAAQVRTAFASVGPVSADLAGSRQGVRFTRLRSNVFGGVVQGNVYYPFRGTTRVSGSATGLDLAQLATQLHLRSWAGKADGAFTATYTPGAGFTASIPTAQAATDHGLFTVKDGHYTSADGLAVSLHGTGMPLTKFYAGLRGVATLDGTLTGAITAPHLTARVTAVDGAFDGRAFAAGQGEISYSSQALRLKNLHFTRPGLTLDIPGGPNGFDPRAGFRNVDVQLQARGAQLDDVLTLFGVNNPCPTTGPITGDMTFRVTPDGLVARGQAQAASAVVHIPFSKGTYPLDLSAVGMTFTLQGRTMTITDLHASRGPSTIYVTGTAESAVGSPTRVDLAYRGDEKTRLQDLPLDLFGIPVALGGPVQVQGTLHGVVNGSGPTPLTVTVAAQSPALTLEQAFAGSGEVALSYACRPDARVLTIDHGRVAGDAFTATSAGRYDFSAHTLDGAWVDLAGIDLPALHAMAAQADSEHFSTVTMLLAALPDDLHGAARAHLTFAGSLLKPQMTLDLGATQLVLGATPLPEVQGRLSSRETQGRYRLHVDNLTASSGTTLASLRGDIDPGAQAVALQFDAQHFPAKMLTAWLPRMRVAGDVGADGTLTGAWEHPVLDAHIGVEYPSLDGVTLARVTAQLHGTRQGIALRDAQLWPTLDTAPVIVAGTVGLNDDFTPAHMPLSLALTVPRESLAAWQGVWPGLRDAQGTVAGGLQVSGTVATPRVTAGDLTLAGGVTLPVADTHFPNRLNDLDLRVRLANTGTASRVTLDALSATLDRVGQGRPDDFQPGQVQASGDVTIPDGTLTAPNRWTWDVTAHVDNAPLDQALCLAPTISGYAKISGDGTPTITGVLFAENVKLHKPKATTPPTASGGTGTTPAFDPHLSLVLQAGQGVRIAQGMFTVPLTPTPLPWPTVHADVAPAYTANMLNPGVQGELAGTWGVVTGTLHNPQVYGRFEVDGKRLSFPLSLFAGVRHARGHVTYSQAAGAKIVMGIPDLPVQVAQTPSS